MRLIQTKIAAIDSWADRRSARLNSGRSLAIATIVIPLVFGLLSLLLGQDSNWDLMNYHFYNAYALFNGKLVTDFAAAGMQSYFNPTLDIPYFLIAAHWPAPLIGFVIGCLHGLNFVILLAIVRLALPNLKSANQYRVPLLLSVAGCLSAGFLSEIGNTMGDNMTALFVLASVLAVLRARPWVQQGDMLPVFGSLAAGVLMGIGCGLKLTNSIYAVALCAAFLFLSIEFWSRIRLAFVFGVGVLAGISISAGYWFLKMWHDFGNPLFPQFNNLFHSALAAPIGVSDTRWLPKGWAEVLLWPFVLTLDPRRVGEVPLRQVIWPVVYILFILLGLHVLRERRSVHLRPELEDQSWFLLSFFCIAFVVWTSTFSVYRYLIPLELVAPLVIWIILNRLVSNEVKARRLAGYLLTITVVIVFPFSTWGHSTWAEKSFSATVPRIERPDATTVIIVSNGAPLAWIIPFYPTGVAFTSIAGSFPESPRYVDEIHTMISKRTGKNYAMIAAHSNFREEILRKENVFIRWLGANETEKGCSALRWITERVHIKARLKYLAQADSKQKCELELAPEAQIDLAEQNRMQVLKSAQILARYDYKLNSDTCVTYSAFVGKSSNPYQLCELR